MPGDAGVTVVTMLVCFFCFACEAAGASRARHSLRPHLCWAGKFMHHSGVEPPRECGRVRGLSDALIARSESDESMFRRHARPCAGHPRPSRMEGKNVDGPDVARSSLRAPRP